jgi:hypothetical protein
MQTADVFPQGQKLCFHCEGQRRGAGQLGEDFLEGRILPEAKLTKDWHTSEVPGAEAPSFAPRVEIEFHAMGWNCEYVYIDFAGVR